jgi:hypothetical protein
MNRTALTVLVVMATISVVSTGAEPDRIALRSEAWKQSLDRQTFQFPTPENNDLLYYLSQFGDDCQVHIVYTRPGFPMLTLRFERDGKELATIRGHTASVFRAEDRVLYFAHFWWNGNGCTVSAHNLESGQKLWETELKGVGSAVHSAYRNDVAIELSRLTGTEGPDEGVVYIKGRESKGDYIEVLDRKTGQLLANKIYREYVPTRPSERR